VIGSRPAEGSSRNRICGSIETVGSGADQTFTAFLRDISERKRAQVELEKREQRFRALVEKSWSGVVLLDSDLAGEEAVIVRQLRVPRTVLGLMAKDLAYAAEEGRRHGVPLTTAASALARYEQALGLSNAEIGRVLGMSESNVGTKLHRVMQRLRRDCVERA